MWNVGLIGYECRGFIGMNADIMQSFMAMLRCRWKVCVRYIPPKHRN